MELESSDMRKLSPQDVTRFRVQEVLAGKGKILVIDPYAVAPHIDDGVLIPDGSQRKAGDARGSFYTNMSIDPIARLVSSGDIEKIILFSDASLGQDHKTAGEIVEEELLEGGNGREPIDPKVQIIHYREENMASTAVQVRALAKYIKDEGIKPQDLVYYTSWEYHGERIENHLEGWNIEATVLYYEYVKQFLNPEFDLDTLNNVLPHGGIEKMEAGFPFYRRQLSRFDKKGMIPITMQKYLGGAHTLDNAKSPNGLEFVYMSGKKRLAQVEEVQILKEYYPDIPAYILDYAVRSTDNLAGKLIKGRAERYLDKVELNFRTLKQKYSGQGIPDSILVRVSAWNVENAELEMDKLIQRAEVLSIYFPEINTDYILHSLVFYPWEDQAQHLQKVRENRAKREKKIEEESLI